MPLFWFVIEKADLTSEPAAALLFKIGRDSRAIGQKDQRVFPIWRRDPRFPEKRRNTGLDIFGSFVYSKKAHLLPSRWGAFIDVSAGLGRYIGKCFFYVPVLLCVPVPMCGGNIRETVSPGGKQRGWEFLFVQEE